MSIIDSIICVAMMTFINGVLKVGRVIDRTKAKDLRSIIDRVLTHKVGG